MRPLQVARLSEDAARAQFRRLRWLASEGRPACTWCGCDAVNTYKCRPVYKCKGCGKQFSDTSGTPWASRKLSFQNLMYLIARFLHNAQGLAARDLQLDLGVHYKTALVWLHKLRAAIADHASSLILRGEVEGDGAKFGGHIRPKNCKKTQRDLRKIPYRDNKRAHTVVALRQRDGAITTCIVKEEAHARSFIKARVERGATLFTDCASGWKPLRGHYQLFQVNHEETYYTPTACTNMVETLWSRLRIMERLHHGIARNYLDLYAAEGAWKLTKAKQKPVDAYVDLMSWMSRKGRSPMVGYFQGKKRGCPVLQADGTIKEWKPSADGHRAAYHRASDGAVIDYQPRKPIRRTWRSNLTFLSAEALLANDFKNVPTEPGVYMIFLRGGRELLENSGLSLIQSETLWTEQGADHVYSGETSHLPTRLRTHLAGDIWASPLRESLLAVQHHLKPLQRFATMEEERDEVVSLDVV